MPARLLRDRRDQLVDSLRAEGFSGTDLEAAFKREYARIILESSIFAHEGRHAIDQTYEPDLSSEELEFRGEDLPSGLRALSEACRTVRYLPGEHRGRYASRERERADHARAPRVDARA